MNAPLFVKVEQYKEIRNNVKHVEEKLHQAEKTLNMLREIKQKEEQQFDAWEKEMNMLKEKLKALNENMTGM